jgi:RNA polymerase sigma factor (sigma-70 family)
MAATVMCGFLDRVRTAIGPAEDVRSDGQLLAAFSDRRDASAFSVLIHRYGPLVWAVCRRACGDGHAAEDAFQATFLVLVRKASSIRPRHSIGGWLHRTATNIALKARAMTQRRMRHESPQSISSEPAINVASEPTDPSALAALDEEITRLPDALRIAVVMCELQGISRREAALRLGIAEGTVSSRLAAARKRLADRLSRRGVKPLGGIAGLLAIGNSAGAGLPSSVMAATTGLVFERHPPVKASVSFLVDGEVRAMFLTKLMPIAAGAIAILALAVGQWPAASAVLANYQHNSGECSERAHTFPPDGTFDSISTRESLLPVPGSFLTLAQDPPRIGVIVVTSFQPLPGAVVYTPDGTELSQVVVGAASAPINAGDKHVCPLWLPRLSPDSKRLVAIKLGPLQGNSGPWTQNHLWLFDLDSNEGPSEPLMTDLRCPIAVWSVDGTRLYGSHVDPEKVMGPREEGKPPPLVSWVYDLKTKTKSPLALPLGHSIVDMSPDGKTLLTVVEDAFDRPSTRTYLVPLDTLKPRLLREKVFKGMRFSPDGKWVIGNWEGKKGDTPSGERLVIVSVADGTEKKIALPEEVDWVFQACWSPDGKRIAYYWSEEIPQPPGAKKPEGVENYKWDAQRLNIADADGRNAKTIIRREYNQRIQGIDWK